MATPPVKKYANKDEDLSKEGYTLTGVKGSGNTAQNIWRKGGDMDQMVQGAALKTDENIVKSKAFQQMAQKDKGYQAGFVGAGGNLESLREKVAMQTETKMRTKEEQEKNPDAPLYRMVQTGGEKDKEFEQYEKNLTRLEREKQKERLGRPETKETGKNEDLSKEGYTLTGISGSGRNARNMWMKGENSLTAGYSSPNKYELGKGIEAYEKKFPKGMQPGQVAEIERNERIGKAYGVDPKGYTRRDAAPPVRLLNTKTEFDAAIKAGRARRGEIPPVKQPVANTEAAKKKNRNKA